MLNYAGFYAYINLICFWLSFLLSDNNETAERNF
jgi:hypothetical protein